MATAPGVLDMFRSSSRAWRILAWARRRRLRLIAARSSSATVPWRRAMPTPPAIGDRQPYFGITHSIRSFVIVTAAGFGNLPG